MAGNKEVLIRIKADEGTRVGDGQVGHSAGDQQPAADKRDERGKAIRNTAPADALKVLLHIG
jgi:hypothetical protein